MRDLPGGSWRCLTYPARSLTPLLHLSLAGKLDQLKGTIVAIPSLNPTGHLQGSFALYQPHCVGFVERRPWRLRAPLWWA